MFNLVQLELPKSLRKIGVRLIIECNNLTSVVSHITPPYAISNLTFVETEHFETNSWMHTPSRATLYVPKGQLTAYQSLKGWNWFAEIKEMSVIGDANDDGTVNTDDIVELVNAILGKPSDHFSVINADANGDGFINAADIVKIVSLIDTNNPF